MDSVVTPDFPIVGIGASAGGINALQQFFAHLPADSGMAFAVVTHLMATQESHLAEILQRHTPMPIKQVTQAVQIQPNCVYVIPPDRDLSIQDWTLNLIERQAPAGFHAPVDLFFRALAQTDGKDIIGMVLSGTGSDGTIGLKAIKEAGGLTLVQDPEEAEYSDMPRSALMTGFVDITLPVKALAERLVEYQRSAGRIRFARPEEALANGETKTLKKILVQLHSGTGHNFEHYKRPTVLRRLSRRMQVNQVEDLSQYLNLLRAHPTEVQALFRDLIISVTRFFRDPEAFTALEHNVIPKLFADKGRNDQVRVWVPGCATGEEAYSLGMLLIEHADTLDAPVHVQLFATDVDEKALHTAREGCYPATIASDVTPTRLQRFFVQTGANYQIKRELRQCILFTTHSLLRDPPFSRIDLISCRNLLMYFKREVQEHVLDLFHYALWETGYLFLGAAETVDGKAETFRVIDKHHYLYQRHKGKHAPLILRHSLVRPVERHEDQSGPTQKRATSPYDLHARLLEQHAPPSILVNAGHEIVHLSETAGRYLLHTGGEPSLNLIKAVRQELRMELRMALFKAFHQGKATCARGIRVAFNGAPTLVDLIVRPSNKSHVPDEYALVILNEYEPSKAGLAASQTGDHSALQPLEQELEHTKTRLQTIVEEFDSAQAELTIQNEELQSINEEYKSITEELETSKEELQSLNEELQILNQELHSKVDELNQLNSDLQNFMTATDIAAIFINHTLHIKRYTPHATEIFNLMPGDRGRPLAHVTHRLKYPTLLQDAEQVLDKLVPIEQEVQDEAGRHFLVCQRPYRTIENKIDGVVITCVDITVQKQAEQDLQSFNEALEERVLQRTNQVRALTSALTLAEQYERRRISQILHDDLQQLLYALQISLSPLHTDVLTPPQQQALTRIGQILERAIQMTRSLTVELSPPVLQGEGLDAAVRWLAFQMRETHGLKVKVIAQADVKVMSEDLRVLLFQLVRELLFNVTKHADVAEVSVTIATNDHHMRILVEDQGRGFDPEAAAKKAGYGLLSIRQRLSMLGGQLEIDSRPGAGTRVTILAPLEPGDPEPAS